MLQGFGNPSTNSFNDANLGAFAFLVPTDFANNPNLPGYAACTTNLLPTTCAPFQAAVQGLLDNPRNTVDPQAKTLIYWINDGGTFNKGTIKIDGIDFQGSYDWDWGDIGAFNVGITGTYYLHRWEQPTDTSDKTRTCSTPPCSVARSTNRRAWNHSRGSATALARAGATAPGRSPAS